MLGFNRVRLITMEESGVAQAVYAFWHDHGYFPRPAFAAPVPASETDQTAELGPTAGRTELEQPIRYVDRLASYVWSHFTIEYLGESKRTLSARGKEESERLPRAFSEAVVNEGRSREGRKKGWGTG